MPEGVDKWGEGREDIQAQEAGILDSAGDGAEKSRTYQGTIKFFDDAKGYGFIRCPEVFELYQSDVFVHHRHFNGLLVGDHVQFRVQVSGRGKPQAVDVREHGEAPVPWGVAGASEPGRPAAPPGAGDGAEASDGSAGARADEDAARTFRGTVKLIDAAKGFGFIRCEEAPGLYGRDVFAQPGLMEGLRVGDPVCFSLRPGRDGRPQAAELSSCDARAPWEAPGERPAGALVHQGTVKRIDAERGYGFVACPALFEIYGGDVFASPKQLGGLAVGDAVSFAVRLNRRGQPQAVGLWASAEAGAEAAGAAEEETMGGTIKSFDAERGYGFISGPEVHGRYGRDVFLHSRQIGRFRPGDHVAFSVRVNGQGQPQACGLREAPRTVAWLAGGEGAAPAPEEYVGEIKSFSSSHGYGFIECPALRGIYGRDVFIHQSQADGLGVGDRIAFRVQLRRGQPQAFGVAPLGAGGRAAAPARPARPEGRGGEELDRRLLRACASARAESLATLEELLAAGADPNGRDVTGHTALMAAALNARGSERKCRLLIEHRADVRARHSSSASVLQWARERISPRFAEFLEAVESGKRMDFTVALDVPRDAD